MPSRPRPQAETCNGIDDDCDGRTDEASPAVPLTRHCYDSPATEGVGCHEGTQACVDGAYADCEGRCARPPKEIST
ncbi:MAG: MopE-related protein [bacterium]